MCYQLRYKSERVYYERTYRESVTSFDQMIKIEGDLLLGRE